jgi:hypothetical protein
MLSVGGNFKVPSLQAEAIKAVLTALGTAVATQVASIFEVLTDSNSPRKVLDEGKKTIDLVCAWGKTSEQIQRVPESQLRDNAQERIDQVLRALYEGQARYAELRENRRIKLFRFLGFIRLSGLVGWRRRIAAVLFYIAAVMLIQTIRLILNKEPGVSPALIGLFGATTALFWLLSWPNKTPRNFRPMTRMQ